MECKWPICTMCYENTSSKCYAFKIQFMKVTFYDCSHCTIFRYFRLVEDLNWYLLSDLSIQKHFQGDPYIEFVSPKYLETIGAAARSKARARTMNLLQLQLRNKCRQPAPLPETYSINMCWYSTLEKPPGQGAQSTEAAVSTHNNLWPIRAKACPSVTTGVLIHSWKAIVY